MVNKGNGFEFVMVALMVGYLNACPRAYDELRGDGLRGDDVQGGLPGVRLCPLGAGEGLRGCWLRGEGEDGQGGPLCVAMGFGACLFKEGYLLFGLLYKVVLLVQVKGFEVMGYVAMAFNEGYLLFGMVLDRLVLVVQACCFVVVGFEAKVFKEGYLLACPRGVGVLRGYGLRGDQGGLLGVRHGHVHACPRGADEGLRGDRLRGDEGDDVKEGYLTLFEIVDL